MSARGGRAASRLFLLAMLAAPNGADAQDFFQDLFGGMEGRPRRERPAPQPPREQRRHPEKPRAEKAPQEKPREEKPAAAEPKSRSRRQDQPRPDAPKPDIKAAGAAGAEPPPPPYDAQEQRLAELLGGLSYLRELCGDGDGADWRARMTKLRDADAPSGPRRLRLTAAFNRGFEGYELTYRRCTPNARLVIARYLDEAEQLSNSIVSRYGAP